MGKLGKRHGMKSGVWHRGSVAIYRCHLCHEWHIGNTTNAVKNKRPRFEPACDWSAAL
jgi:hypothetical protein